jgi:hypothetical protein
MKVNVRLDLKPPFDAPFNSGQDSANIQYYLKDIAESLRFLVEEWSKPQIIIQNPPLDLTPGNL